MVLLSWLRSTPTSKPERPARSRRVDHSATLRDRQPTLVDEPSRSRPHVVHQRSPGHTGSRQCLCHLGRAEGGVACTLGEHRLDGLGDGSTLQRFARVVPQSPISGPSLPFAAAEAGMLPTTCRTSWVRPSPHGCALQPRADSASSQCVGADRPLSWGPPVIRTSLDVDSVDPTGFQQGGPKHSHSRRAGRVDFRADFQSDCLHPVRPKMDELTCF